MVDMDGFTDTELLELVFGKRITDKADKDMLMVGMIKGSIDQLRDSGLTEKQMLAVKGVGELSKRLWSTELNPMADMSSPRNVADYYMQSLRSEDQEHVYIMMLDTRNRLKKSALIGLGTINACSASPREIYKKALSESAAGIILIHNHPSGDPHPSGEDIQFTRTLKEGGKLLAVPLLDSLIIGDNSYYSFKEEGML